MKKRVLSLVLACFALMAAQAQRFALIDMEYILKQIPAYEQANTKLETSSKKWQSEVEAITAQAKSLYEDYQKTAKNLNATQKKQKEDAIVAKEKEASELRRKYFGNEGEMQKLQQSLMEPIQNNIYTAVKEIATRKGYSLVLDRASDTGIIFASPSIDISDEVLTKLGY